MFTRKHMSILSKLTIIPQPELSKAIVLIQPTASALGSLINQSLQGTGPELRELNNNNCLIPWKKWLPFLCILIHIYVINLKVYLRELILIYKFILIYINVNNYKK
jgi:hypothetical protein